MKIKYLGTSAAEGIPGLFCNCVYCNEARRRGGKDLRTRSQSIIDNTLLIDFPADSLSHMYKYEIPISHIHNILITHTHQDHLYLEDFGLRSKYYGFAHNIDQMLTVYGNDTFIKKFDAMYPQNSHYEQAKPNITCRELTEYKTVDIDGYNVTALLARHDPNEKCFIYYIERGGTSLLYGNDTGWFPEPTWKFLADKTIDLVSLDCTFAKYAEGSGHMGIPDNIKVRNKLNELGCLLPTSKFVITHFAHNGHMLHADIEKLGAKQGFIAAYDGMEVVF